MPNRTLAAFLLIGAIPCLGYAEDSGRPQYKLDARKRIIELSNFSGAVKGDCQPARLVGRVVKRHFDQDRAVEVTGVTIEEPNGSRTFAHVQIDSDFSLADRSWVYTGLQTLLKEGNRVSLQIGFCGAAGHVVTVASIQLVR